MTSRDLPGLTIVELQKLLRAREVTPREVLEALQERIETLEPKIDAYLSAISTPLSPPPRRSMCACR